MRRGSVVGIDIGSTKIATVVAQVAESGVDVIGVGTAENTGVRKGMIIDVEETISALSASLEEAERMSGLNITDAVVSVSGQHIEIAKSRGVVAVSRPGQDINEDDVDRAIEGARSSTAPANREIIHSIPLQYSVDGQTGIKDPVGLAGVRLEVETLLITGLSSVLKNTTKCLNQAGVTVNQFIFTPLAVALAVTTKKQRSNGVLVMDLGAQTTDYVVYEDDQVLTIGTIPLGSAHITNDLAIGLRTSIDVAEEIKRHYGVAQPSLVKEKKLAGAKVGFDEEIDLALVADIIEARLNEICVMVREQLRRINRDSQLPGGVVLTGGGAHQQGVVQLLKDTLKLPVAIGEVTRELSGMVDNVSEPDYATSVGLVLYALEATNDAPRPWIKLKGGNWRDIAGKTRSIFKNLFP